MFKEVPSQFDFPASEREISKFWEEHRVYEQSLKQREGRPPFVFYEGPPTANGLPHPGHCLTRIIKDIFPRYKTMRGHYCHRKGGWDTHGLPVEAEVCKELGIHTKAEIEQHGVEHFIQLCQQSVFRYTKEWEELTRRLGFWINLDEAYVTYHQSYVESVWWALATLFKRGLLYQGHKIVWWWPQGGTALSSGGSGTGLSRSRRPFGHCAFSPPGRTQAQLPRLDDDSLDAAEQHRISRSSRFRIRRARSPGRAVHTGQGISSPGFQGITGRSRKGRPHGSYSKGYRAGRHEIRADLRLCDSAGRPGV